MSTYRDVFFTLALMTFTTLAACGGGNTPPPGAQCMPACAAPLPFCDAVSAMCVECLIDRDCGGGQVCVQKDGKYQCQSGCRRDADCAGQAGTTCCENECVDVMKTSAHCGACGKACAAPPNASAQCTAGGCGVAMCNAGFGDCNMAGMDGCEAEFGKDPTNCGACGTKCMDPPNGKGGCQMGACGLGECNMNFADCDKQSNNGCEVNTLSNDANCGTCGTVCGAVPNGTSSCRVGKCEINLCTAGFGSCDMDAANGCEADLQGDAKNCGMCGTMCMAPANASAACVRGACGVGVCNMGYADCDGNGANGCESKVDEDARNCGGCGRVCPNIANGAGACMMGKCVVTMCNQGFSDCDGTVGHGCETSLNNNASHCGMCGVVCGQVANGAAACSGGMCTVGACNPGFADCDKQFQSGCEVATATNAQNCGGCGLTCPNVRNASPACQGGRCVVGMCNPNFGDCDGQSQNGCERSLQTDVNNCGGCNRQCPAVVNGTQACAGGSCLIQQCNQGFLDCDRTYGNGCEVTSASDLNNCGACNNACPARANAARTCGAGQCGYTCNAGYADCNRVVNDGCEISTNTNVSNCGSCGNVCNLANAAPTCTQGACAVQSCNQGFSNCDGVAGNGCERNTTADINNCGSCGRVCAAVANGTQSCVNSVCTIAMCSGSFADCDMAYNTGCEINKNTDPAHCGACGNSCPLPANSTRTCTNAVCGFTCLAGYRDCNNNPADGCEINLTTSPQNCGACGMACAAQNGVPGCANSVCTVASCNMGFANCDGIVGNGCERVTSTDINNCGACNRACTVANGTPVCTNSNCAVSMCNAGFDDCDMQYGSGCEINKNTDILNCGACNNRCPARANATTTCGNGVCGFTCLAGYRDCNMNPADGCEINITNDPANCNACAAACNLANATPTCTNSVCVATNCTAGWSNCNGLNADGCERSTAMDLNNCGACGRICSVSNGTPACMNSTCAVATCTAPFDNCDMQYANGCEVNKSSTLDHCGACGNACPIPANASRSCVNGTCGIASCNALWGNCDGQVGNGCELPLAADINNCGLCSRVCGVIANGLPSCAAGVCGAACNMGFGNCDANLANGCEANFANNISHCGQCGRACTFPNATAACMNGTCALTGCNAGYGSCDGNDANGCETDTNSSAGNCGACGNVCPANLPVCSNGGCVAGPVLPYFSSMPGAPSSSTVRAAGEPCGTVVTMTQQKTLVQMAAYLTLPAQGSIKFMVWSHPGHALVYITSPKVFAAGTGWLKSDPFPALTLNNGAGYDFGASVSIGGVTYHYDSVANSQNGVSSLSQNPNWLNYAAPTFNGHAGVDCGIQLF